METTQMRMAFALARYRKMVNQNLPDFQMVVVERYGDLITRQMRKLTTRQIIHVYEIAEEFEKVI